MPSVSELCDRLKIRHPSEQSTCIGYGQRKPTCGCAVAIASRTNAVDVLTVICRGMRVNSQVAQSDLRKIASLLLCKRFHQFQADEKAQKWVVELQNWSSQLHVPGNENDTSSRPSHLSTRQRLTDNAVLQARCNSLADNLSSLRDDHVGLQSDYNTLHEEHENLQYLHQRLERRHQRLQNRELCLDAVSDNAIIEEVRKRLGNATSQILERSIVAMSTQLREATRDESNIEPRVDARTEQVLTTETQVNTRERSSSTPAESDAWRRSITIEDNVSQPQHLSQPSTQPLNQQTVNSSIAQGTQNSESISADTRTAAPVPREERDDETNPASTARARPSSLSRHSHTECSICLERYEENVQDFWECQECQNRIHSHCFELWTASHLDIRPVKCVYCRAVV